MKIIDLILTIMSVGICNLNFDLVLKIIQTIAAVVASASISIALLNYLYNKNRNNCIAAIDQITFFRKEIIPTNKEFLELVRAKNDETYIFSRVKLDEPSIEYTREHFLAESRRQTDLFVYRNITDKQMDVLNMLEELSLKILHFKTINHSALDCIKAPFIEFVEMHAIVLLLQREIVTGKTTYSSILEIYDKWKDNIDRRTPEERQADVLSKLGITQ